ncbi:MAG: NRDE family protein [Candidatus Binatus sp.]
MAVNFDRMCTLAIYFRAARDFPVVIAANRDEFLERPAADPITLLDSPHVVGGKDLKAGGTWLGISEHGIVAGLLNRRAEGGANPEARSRGLLCLDALRRRTAAEAAEFAGRERGSDYNPFNLLMVSRTEAFVAYNRGASIEVVALKPGLHLLSNLDVNDFECPKISASYGKFAALGNRADFQRDPIGHRAALGALLADHNTQLDSRVGTAAGGKPNALCLHLENYGTRSSSLIFMRGDTAEVAHYFAPGPPCTTAYGPAIVPRRNERNTLD